MHGKVTEIRNVGVRNEQREIPIPANGIGDSIPRSNRTSNTPNTPLNLNRI
jgi:hypothetical protein